MKNITLRAEESLIEAARLRAAAEGTSLDTLFRQWLAEYVGRERQADAAVAAIHDLREDIANGGRTFTRDEMNERR